MPIASISPQVIQVDSVAGLVPLNVYGSGFVDPTTKINYDGGDVATTFISSTQLQANINPSGATRPRHVEIKVTGDASIRYLHWTPGPQHGLKTIYDYPYW